MVAGNRADGRVLAAKAFRASLATPFHSIRDKNQNPLHLPNISQTSGFPQMGKSSPAMLETWVQSLGWEDPPEKGMATHSSFLA